MKSLIFLAITLAIAHAGFVDEWTRFKALHNKQYAAHEEPYRRQVFYQNLERINAHNRLADQGLKTWRRGINQFSDLTVAEWRRQYLTAQPALRHWAPVAQHRSMSEVSLSDLPKSVDWRQKGVVTPVKDQGGCGSCWAFSTVVAIEGQHALQTGKLVSLSEQNLVDCSGDFGNFGCSGGWPFNAYAYVIKNNGIDTEKAYPYTAQDQNCQYNAAGRGAGVSSYTNLTSGDEQALQKGSATVGPISICIDATPFFDYTSGVLNPDQCGKAITELDHCVGLIGYGTTDQGVDYWLVKNSWGTGWGENGYVRMIRNKDNTCGVATAATYPQVN